jgi:hypothetical protein
MIVVNGCDHGSRRPKEPDKVRVFVAFAGAGGVNLIVEGGIFYVELIRGDSDDRPFMLLVYHGLLGVLRQQVPYFSCIFSISQRNFPPRKTS